jgi:PEP-CTERM motif
LISGDFNQNGTVDAADYIVWRDGLGTTYTQDDYKLWRAHFGQSAGSASIASAAIPEPSTLALLMLAIVGQSLCRR